MDDSTPARDGGPRPTMLTAMLMLLGPFVSTVALAVVCGGYPLGLLRECGTWGYLAVGAALVMTLANAGLLWVAAHGRHRLAALAAPLALVPFAVSGAGLALGTVMVRDVLSATPPESQLILAAVGGSELMSLRAVGACMVFGHALALSGAWLALARAHGANAAARKDAALGTLASLGLTGVALAIIMDAQTLRLGLGAAREGGRAQLTELLTEALTTAQASHTMLIVAVAVAGVMGLVCAASALRNGMRSALAVLSPSLVCVIFAGSDAALLETVADGLTLRAPWAAERDFVPLEFASEDGPALPPTCVAGLEGIRCGPDRSSPYQTLGTVIPGPERDQGWEPEALEEEDLPDGEPSLAVAIDARLGAPDLRRLIEAAANAEYASVMVIGAWTPPAFLDGNVPAMLRGQVPRIAATRWLLRTLSPATVARLQPRIIDVGSIDTSDTLTRRTTAAAAGGPVLVRPESFAHMPTTAMASGAATPEPSAAEAAPATGTALDPSTISRVVRRHTSAIRQCYERGLRTQPELSGRIDVRFTILPSGEVSAVSAMGTLDAASVVRCVEDKVGRIVFPAGDGREPATVVYPVVFNSNR